MRATAWSRYPDLAERRQACHVIAVSSDPLADPTEMERVRFVMKGGMVVKDEVTPAAVHTQ
jgi:hypothetical protein